MRLLLLALLALASIPACTPQRPARVTPGVAGRAADGARVETGVVVGPAGRPLGLARFVAAVPATEEGGQCDTLRVDGPEGPSTLVILSFPRIDSTTRNVSVTYDASGRRLHFSDLRGDLRRVKTGPQTSVLLDFTRGTASASNEWPGRSGEIASGALAEALAAANLGPPQRALDLVQARCGAR
jgi:hypothetical protein